MKDNISTNIELAFFGKAFLKFMPGTITKKGTSNNFMFQFMSCVRSNTRKT